MHALPPGMFSSFSTDPLQTSVSGLCSSRGRISGTSITLKISFYNPALQSKVWRKHKWTQSIKAQFTTNTIQNLRPHSLYWVFSVSLISRNISNMSTLGTPWHDWHPNASTKLPRKLQYQGEQIHLRRDWQQSDISLRSDTDSKCHGYDMSWSNPTILTSFWHQSQISANCK